MMPRHFTGSTERHFTDGNAIAADRYLGQDYGFCSICDCTIGPSRHDDKPRHHAFADLCEDCGDEVQARMEER